MIRIVKMTFQDVHCEDFLNHFEKIKNNICTMPGCEGLRLHRDFENPHIFFTYSQWNTDADLQNYRHSALFIDTWKIVKPWFAQRAEAWSVNTIFDHHAYGVFK